MILIQHEKNPCFNGDCACRNKPGIFIVEDNPGVCQALSITLQDLGYSITGSNDSAEGALQEIAHACPDLIIMDINLSGEMDGIDAAAQIRDKFSIPVIFLTGCQDDERNERITAAGPYGYLVKPFNERELRLTIDIALYKSRIDTSIRESEEFYRTLAEALDFGIIQMNEDRTVRYINPAGQNLIKNLQDTENRNHTATQGQSLSSVLLQPEVTDFIEELFVSGEPAHKIWKAGECDTGLWLDIHGIPVQSDGNAPCGILLILHDVTRQKEFEIQAHLMGASRIEENMEKFQILNDTIRNPLQVLTGLIVLEDLPSKARYIEQINAINKVVHDFDQAWIRSEKVRRFLLTHYGHGNLINNNSR